MQCFGLTFSACIRYRIFMCNNTFWNTFWNVSLISHVLWKFPLYGSCCTSTCWSILHDNNIIRTSQYHCFCIISSFLKIFTTYMPWKLLCSLQCVQQAHVAQGRVKQYNTRTHALFHAFALFHHFSTCSTLGTWNFHSILFINTYTLTIFCSSLILSMYVVVVVLFAVGVFLYLRNNQWNLVTWSMTKAAAMIKTTRLLVLLSASLQLGSRAGLKWTWLLEKTTTHTTSESRKNSAYSGGSVLISVAQRNLLLLPMGKFDQAAIWNIYAQCYQIV